MAESNENVTGLPEENLNPNSTGAIPKTFVCTICKDINKSPNLSITKCGHKFHRSCIHTFLQSNHKCPVDTCGTEIHYADLTKIRKNKKIVYPKNTERILRSHRMYQPNTILYEDVNSTDLMTEMRNAEKSIQNVDIVQNKNVSQNQMLLSSDLENLLQNQNHVLVNNNENQNLNNSRQNTSNINFPPLNQNIARLDSNNPISSNLSFPPPINARTISNPNLNHRQEMNYSQNSEYRNLPNTNNPSSIQINSPNLNNSSDTQNTVQNFINPQNRYLNSNHISENQLPIQNSNQNSLNINSSFSNNSLINSNNQNLNSNQNLRLRNSNLQNSNQNSNCAVQASHYVNSNLDTNHTSNYNSNFPNSNNNPLNSQNNNPTSINISIDQISQLIESSVERMFNRLSLNSNLNQNLINHNSPNFSNFQTPQNNNVQNPIASNVNTNNNPDFSLTSSNFHTSSYQIRVTNIMQSWNIKFDGSDSGLSVEEFIYRIKSLTADYLNNDFHLLSKHLHILLHGKAREWYWRYRKQVPNLNWNNLCTDLRYQYKDFKTASDIKQQIRNRKQREGETFQIFFDDIVRMSDRLPTPLEEEELIEIVMRNLLPEIRKEMLYVNILSINQLRKLCFMRENLLNEEKEIRKSHNFPRANQNVRRNIYAVEYDEDVASRENVASQDFECVRDQETDVDMQVSAINSQRKLICANCDKEGHHWQNCLAERRVFCYGCLAKGVYKPQCKKCNPPRSENLPKGTLNATPMYPKNTN